MVANMISLEHAQKAAQNARSAFERLGSFVGVALVKLNNEYAIKINLTAKPPADVVLPDSVDGVPVIIEVVGRIRPLAD